MNVLSGWAIAVLWVSPTVRAAAQEAPVVVPPLKGHVQTIEGTPIADAEVKVLDVNTTGRSDARGAFSILNVPKGIHTITVRRLGWLPATAAVAVPQTNDSLTIILVPIRTNLDTLKVTAHVNVLAGVVVDEHDRPISGALVDLGDSGSGTDTTGDDGWFTFTSVRSGPTIIHVLRAGYVGAMQSVKLQDWRGVVVHMERIDATLSANRQEILSGLGNSARLRWIETQTRLARRVLPAVVITREELAPLGKMELGQAVTQTTSGAQVMSVMESNHNTACVLLNGDRMIGQTSLDRYNAENVEFVELYPPGTEPTGTVAQYMQIAGCSATHDGSTRMRGGRVRGATPPVGSTTSRVFYAVIWLKS